MIIFDIETGPRSKDEVLALADPFDESNHPHPGEFDPETVKCGNLGPEKAAAKIADAAEKHRQACLDHENKVEQARRDYEQAIMDRAALAATTGYVIAIGFFSTEKRTDAIVHGDEAEVLQKFWNLFLKKDKIGERIAGFNIFGFDLPFIMQRSWILEVDVPDNVRVTYDRYWSNTFLDLMDKWKCGNRWSKDRCSLDLICKALGVEGKLEGVSGADFAKLWMTDRSLAIKYLKADLQATYQVASRLGCI